MNNKVVYIHRRGDTGDVFYIGYGNPDRPYDTSQRNRWWHIVKTFCGFNVEIILTGLSPNEAKSWEIYLIGLYGRRSEGNGNLVNMTDGGDGAVNTICSDELRESYRRRMLGRVMSEESKKKLSESRIGKYAGENSYNYGKKRSEDTKKKISDKHKGRIVSKEHRLKISNTLKGKYTGDKSFKGTRVIDISTGYVYRSIKMAADSIGINPSTLRAKLSGQNPNNTNLKFYNEKSDTTSN